jgi:hypothetical protein
MKLSEALAEVDWMPTMREARGSVRGKTQTTQYQINKVAQTSLRTHFVSDLAEQLENMDHDENRNNYQPLIMKGRVVR